MATFAYLFERFPSFVQTFVYREAGEMVRQKMAPWLVSIRQPEDHSILSAPFCDEVFYLPSTDTIRRDVDQLRKANKLPFKAHSRIPEARSQKDSTRLFEAAWLGPLLKQRGIRHVHAHFGGMAARTAWWLKEIHGITYSFTGHANDIFCDTDFPITNADLVHRAEFVVTETDFARRWMENKYPTSTGRVFRVYNGVDTHFPQKQPRQPLPKIISVGRYVEKKGFADLIRACSLLRAQGLTFQCEIIGGGPLEAPLNALVNELGLQGCVQLTGPRSQKEVREALASADLFVLACVPDQEGGSDNLPTVIMEAMICGVPVVSTHLAGVPEMISDGKTGKLTAPGTPAALAAAMASLLKSDAECSRLASAAKEFALNHFALDATTRQLKHLLVSKANVIPPLEARAFDPALPSPPPWWKRFLGA